MRRATSETSDYWTPAGLTYTGQVWGVVATTSRCAPDGDRFNRPASLDDVSRVLFQLMCERAPVRKANFDDFRARSLMPR